MPVTGLKTIKLMVTKSAKETVCSGRLDAAARMANTLYLPGAQCNKIQRDKPDFVAAHANRK